MLSHKELLREKFSSQPDKYYKVELFSRLGFVRKQCTNCHAFFWTLEARRTVCPDPTCQDYEFLGNPTPESMDYVTTWKNVSDFYARNGHHIVKRYPVVCRWRPDIYFTIASVVDFQRIESGKVVFEFPSNPLVVPQMCLRFVDIGNVGVTGRHYTSFCMIGQQALANAEGYWKDRCIDLVFDVLNRVLLVPKEEIVFREDVWVGPGAFGYCLDYYVRGLEMGNAVFTQFEGTPDQYIEYREPVVDMGAGLERWAWLTNGTATSYEVVFQRPLEKLKERMGDMLSDEDRRYLLGYYKLAGGIDVEKFKGDSMISDEFMRKIGVPDPSSLRVKLTRLQAIYSILDHTRTLLFAISDGALPSNVGGGYNLRVILRRALDFARQLDSKIDLGEIAEWHAEQLRSMYPELLEHTEDCRTILEVESQKYELTRERAKKIVESLSKNKAKISTDKMIELYESEGITPETLVRGGLEATVPPDFYLRVTEKHETQKREEVQKQAYDVSGLPPTKLLFYEKRDTFEFQSKVLRVLDERYVILESTGFYPRGGGQEPDHGTIEGLDVVDVTKFKNIVVHEMSSKGGRRIEEGQIVSCLVDSQRRGLIMRHHTATHIVNGAARKVIGSWVWQHSAFKDENMARLDITHFAHLTREQVLEIERVANEVVRDNLPVTISWIPRNQAEQTYGFRIYQGGVVPSKELRIVSIQGWDVEACGGTHCSSTGEVGLIKITKTERVQDGVERIEFVAGAAALSYVQTQERILLESAAALETPLGKVSTTIANLKESESASRRTVRYLSKSLAELTAEEILKESMEAPGGLLLHASLPKSGQEDDLGQEYYTLVGEKVSSREPKIVYVAMFNERDRSRIMIFVGKAARDSGVNAGLLIKEISKRFKGSGGGDSRFAQGGLPRLNLREGEARTMILEVLKDSISTTTRSGK